MLFNFCVGRKKGATIIKALNIIASMPQIQIGITWCSAK